MSNKIGFNLNKINTLQYAVIDDAYDSSVEEFGLDVNLGFGMDFENHAMMSLVKVQFEQKKNNPYLILEVSCEFDIEPEFWKEFKNKTIVKVPKGFMSHLAMITVGTTRGVLHSKTDNTKFNSYILPTINVASMITSDGEFKK